MKAHSFLNWHFFLSAPPVLPTTELTHVIQGDDAVTVKYRTDRGMDKVGADGKMAMAISADRSCEVSIKLQQTSPSNKVLNDLLGVQNSGAAGFAPLQMLAQDNYRRDQWTGINGYIKTAPDIARGAGLNDQEWVLVFEKLDLRLENSQFVGFATAQAEAT